MKKVDSLKMETENDDIPPMADVNVGIKEDNIKEFASSITMNRFKLEPKRNLETLTANNTNLSVTPIMVDFYRLMQQEKHGNDSNPVVSGISNRDLLHAVVGLYDTSLTELTPDVIYSTVCSKWAKTIILVRDVKDVFLEFEKRRDDHSLCKVDLKYSHIDISDMRVHLSGEDKYRAPDPPPSTFAPCYSDSETEEEDDSDDDDDDDYSKGINTYLQQATARRKSRLSHSGPFSLNHVGPENRVIAACTFDRKYIKTGEKITHLTLLTIRKRFRRLGLGKYLLEKVKDVNISGRHEAVVVHAETEAAPFFSRYGFSDDLLLNSRWKEIAEQFTNCLLLTYIPPYTGESVTNEVSDLDLLSLEKDLRKWKNSSLEAYQSQVTIIERMKSEMIRLRSMVSSQDDVIRDLQAKVSQLETEKLKTENQLMMHKIELLALQTDRQTDGGCGEAYSDTFTSSDTLLSRYQILSNFQADTDGDGPNIFPTAKSAPLQSSSDQELKRYIVVPQSAVEVYDHGKDIAEFHRICEDFKNSMRQDSKMHRNYTVTTVSKALLSQAVVDRYAKLYKESRKDNSTVMKLYYCGSQRNPERLKDILKNGFSEMDLTEGDYGKGLYFSSFASTAVHFSVPNKVLVAEVIVGRYQRLLSKDRQRSSSDKGFCSVLCPGRLAVTGEDNSSLKEYVIYDTNQALPLDLIEFTETQVSPTTSS